jgi:ribonuclease BN (tRNA processing enzyme)
MRLVVVPAASLEGCVRLTIIGPASAEPIPGNASSCYLITSVARPDKDLLLDCGHGAAARVLLYTTPERIGSIVISHMHPDHFFDLVPLLYMVWLHGRPKIPLFLPPTGPDILAGIARGLHEKEDFWSRAFDIKVYDPASELSLLGIQVAMTQTHHYIPGWAMRFTEADSAPLVYTADTALTNDVVEFASGAGLIVAESSLPRQTEPEEARGHMTPGEAGRLAREAGAGTLVLSHYPAELAGALVAAAAAEFSGHVVRAEEGLSFEL